MTISPESLPELTYGHRGAHLYSRAARTRCAERRKEPPLETLALFHDRLSLTVVFFMFAVGLWGLLAFARGASLGGSISGAMVIGQILIMLQVVLGVALLIGDRRPIDSMHYLYGVTILIVMPFAYSYLQRRDPRQALLFFSLVALFIGGLAIRAISTGS